MRPETKEVLNLIEQEMHRSWRHGFWAGIKVAVAVGLGLAATVLSTLRMLNY